jgi:hypothetical protein
VLVAILLVYDFESDVENTDMDLAKAAANLVMKWPSKQQVALGSLWHDQACVIFFMRRFG